MTKRYRDITVSTAATTAPSLPTRSPLITWGARVVWAAVALTGAVAVDQSLDGADPAARVIVPALWWVLVAATLLALVVPSPTGLTAVRLATPLTVALAVATLLAGADTAWGAGFLVASLGAVGTFLSADFASVMVQGSAYGSEQRFPLRAPVAVLVPMVVSWIAWASCTVAGVALLARSSWVVGIVLAVVSVAIGVALFPRYQRLARRWLVIVPAGVVLHDSLVLGETLMVQRPEVARVGLAPAGTEAADLSGPAAGHLIEVVLRDMTLAVFPASSEHPQGRAIHLQSYLVAPSRPGRALRAMAAARLPVG